jgi:hypothetical protein
MGATRRTAWFAAAVLGAFATAAAAEPPPVKGPWDGFGAGSSVTQKSTMTSSMAEMPATTTETRTTLVKVTDDACVIKTETEVGEEWMGQEMTIPRKATGTEDPNLPKPKVEDLGTEKVTVDGTDYECKKQKTVMDGSSGISWTHEKHGVLKVESTHQGGTSTILVTKLSTKVAVGGKEVDCRETKIVSKMQGGVETDMVTLESDAVPGRNVRSESTMKMAAMTTKTVSETTAFEAK